MENVTAGEHLPLGRGERVVQGAVDVAEESLATMYQVWLGRRDLLAALRSGEIDIGGNPAIAKRLPDAMMLSPISYASAD